MPRTRRTDFMRSLLAYKSLQVYMGCADLWYTNTCGLKSHLNAHLLVANDTDLFLVQENNIMLSFGNRINRKLLSLCSNIL